MSTKVAQPIRLEDYRPPAFLIDEVQLDFELDPRATRVRARLAIRRNGNHTDPLRLNGERLRPIAIAIDGRPLSAAEHSIDGEWLTVPGVQILSCLIPRSKSTRAPTRN